MQTLALRSPLPALLTRPWRTAPFAARALSSESQARGGLPRFHSELLPSSKGDVVRVQGDEFWHMTRVLRLTVNDRVEIFNGIGGLVEGCIQKVDKNGLDVMALEDPKLMTPKGIQWHVFAAFGTLKGGRADWLVEKCTELGASSVTPLLTQRSPTIPENRVDRLQRVVLAAVKQCQRIHEMTLNHPLKVHDLLPIISESKLSFLAAAEATPVIGVLATSSVDAKGLIIVGPEGGQCIASQTRQLNLATEHFTEEEMKLMTEAGAISVGLGPCRLRSETATIALLSTLMLWSDAQRP